MKYIFCSFLLVILVSSKSPAQISFVPGETKFSVGIFFTPEAFFLGKLPEDVKLGTRISCSYGLNVRYNVSKKWTITSGVHGSNKVFMANVTVKDKHHNYVGSFTKKSSYAFVEMPLLLSYEREYNKIVSIYGTAGVIGGYLSHEKVADPGAHTSDIIFDGKNAYLYQSKAYVYDRTDLDGFGYYKFLLSSYVGIGAMLKIDKNVSFLIQPNFKYAITDMHKKEPSKFPLQYSGRPYSFGIMAGCYIRI
jgi:hypothetical protein